MKPRPLHAMDAGPGSLQEWATALRSALDGTGPGLVPVPVEPPAVRDALLQAFRPDDPGSPLESDAVALVVPTSGSTGEPKGALLAAAALRASAGATLARLGGPGHWLLALPLTHVAGLMVLVRSLLGAELLGTEQVGLPEQVPAGGFDAASFARATATAARRARADGTPLYTALVPTQLRRVLDDPAARCLTAYDAILVGAAATPQSLLDRAAAAGACVVTTYGMSETCGGCVYDGRPLDGVRITVDEDGRVLVGGPTLFSGYRLRPDLSAEALDPAGRLITTDHGALSADGTLTVLGRLDEVIVSGGEKVVPAQVEHALAALPGVAGAVVVGLPDPEWGERVVAVVETRDGSLLRLSDVRAQLAGRLPPAALPRALHLASPLPLLATGKPDRAAARALALAADRADAPVGLAAADVPARSEAS